MRCIHFTEMDAGRGSSFQKVLANYKVYGRVNFDWTASVFSDCVS